MELILERISRKVAFSAKVDFLVPEAVPIVPASGQVWSRMQFGHAKGIKFLGSATPPMPCLLRGSQYWPPKNELLLKTQLFQ